MKALAVWVELSGGGECEHILQQEQVLCKGTGLSRMAKQREWVVPFLGFFLDFSIAVYNFSWFTPTLLPFFFFLHNRQPAFAKAAHLSYWKKVYLCEGCYYS